MRQWWSPAARHLLAVGGLCCWFAFSAYVDAAPATPDAPAPAATESAPPAPGSSESAPPSPSPSPSPASKDADPDDPDLPAVFKKRVPEGVEDLRALQTHLRTLVEKLSVCTVSIQIGLAQGSGVIVSADGFILTAAHVSGKPGRRVDAIVLHDGRTVTGTTYGRDDTLDAGLIKIDHGTDWPHSDMAPASSIEFGEWCVATGHPGGHHEGRPPVLRLGRVLFATKRVIQSDCELVGGDSGGPLFDMHGRVIGINSRIGEETRLNFHVPIGAYSQSWERLTASESFNSHSGALLGVSGKPHASGLEITTVHPGEPADDAGIKVGDILVTLGARKVTDMQQLVDLIGTYQPRREVKLELLRDGKLVELKVRLAFRFD